MPLLSGSPTVRRRRLAAELRRLRERAQLTGDEVANDLGWSPSKVSRYELARTGLKPKDVAKLLDYYGVDAMRRKQLLELAEEATEKEWWAAYSDVLPEELSSLIAMETEARSTWLWHLEVIPGLLQTESYAREVNRGYQRISGIPPGQMERRLAARLARQEILARDPPFELSVVLDESALRRRMASNSVMRAQLEHLIDLAELPNVTLRIMPLGSLYPIVTGSFVFMRFSQARDTTLPDVVYAESLSGNLYFEDEAETYLYQKAFERLAEVSLEPPASVELVSRTAERVWV